MQTREWCVAFQGPKISWELDGSRVVVKESTWQQALTCLRMFLGMDQRLYSTLQLSITLLLHPYLIADFVVRLICMLA